MYDIIVCYRSVMLGFREIEAFRAVMECGSISAAARMLATSQPNVTRLIAVLQRRVSYPLFIRHSRGVTPTPEAEMLFAEVDRSFNGLTEIERAAQEIGEYKGTQITLGTVSAAVSQVIPKAVSAWQKAVGDISITVELRGTQGIFHWVRTRRFDLGLVSPLGEMRDVNVVARWRMPYVALGATRHPGFGETGKLFDIANSGDTPLIVPGMGYILALCEDTLLARMIRKKRSIDGYISLTAAHLAMAGLGIALVDPFTAHYFEGAFDAEVRKWNNAPLFDLVLIAPPDQARSRASVRLGEMLISEIEDVISSCSWNLAGNRQTT
ncbi:LysR family transcriptional regulator [Mesorhizobium sp.]|uniref:LysR family transcriptional regulator n=1 Tax=Mesorhizobium sp. TaxID=1871066 RepID=UPI0025DA25E8|nr:LysR family transcriptional regulator [Mesorhizobium sp.]